MKEHLFLLFHNLNNKKSPKIFYFGDSKAYYNVLMFHMDPTNIKHSCDYKFNKYKTINVNKFDTFLLGEISIKLFKHECNATQRDCYMRHFLQFFSYFNQFLENGLFMFPHVKYRVLYLF